MPRTIRCKKDNVFLEVCGASLLATPSACFGHSSTKFDNCAYACSLIKWSSPVVQKRHFEVVFVSPASRNLVFA